MNLYKKGFTLIELLVVISIIGILASIVIASLDSSRKKGRDARRLSDIKQLQLALEVYYDQNNQFPTGADGGGGYNCLQVTDLVNAGYISVIPTDPSTGACYNYAPLQASSNNGAGPCISYHLGATLESPNHSALTQDADVTATVLTNKSMKICGAAGSPASGDYNGLATGANCKGVTGSAAPNGSPPIETCYDVMP